MQNIKTKFQKRVKNKLDQNRNQKCHRCPLGPKNRSQVCPFNFQHLKKKINIRISVTIQKQNKTRFNCKHLTLEPCASKSPCPGF